MHGENRHCDCVKWDYLLLRGENALEESIDKQHDEKNGSHRGSNRFRHDGCSSLSHADLQRNSSSDFNHLLGRTFQS